MSEADRELLELAAKAGGIEWDSVLRDGGVFFENGRQWDPLKDDGDALRLAVKLKIDIEFHHENPHEGEVVTATKNSIHSICCFENTAMNSSLLAATRRAIVRAAAEIGKS